MMICHKYRQCNSSLRCRKWKPNKQNKTSFYVSQKFQQLKLQRNLGFLLLFGNHTLHSLCNSENCLLKTLQVQKAEISKI